MQCTINNVIADEDTTQFCDQWNSKHKYNKLAIGGATKFELLYIDFEIFGTRFDNTIMEGGIRPPNLIQAGFYGNSFPGTELTTSIQWDQQFYQGQQVVSNALTYYSFNITNPEQTLSCPGIESDYWISFYNEDTQNPVLIGSVAFIDETMRQYKFENICQSDGEWNTHTSKDEPCPDPNYPDYKLPNFAKTTDYWVAVGDNNNNNWFDYLYPFILPDCVYNHPDQVNNETVIVTDGMQSASIVLSHHINVKCTQIS